ncbi:LAMI_0H05248g1_1 [Lachancea mirantina]|uniref:LAMI_0H05248g1_1 n=1 Tax=Lachancea mirantina TaxID=1230905 RepID=A0A1G4KF77_9SACH|nr:LAMI_0H05248g1_1 [Lachancea mirantina]
MSFESVKNLDSFFYTPISCSQKSFKTCQLPNEILALLVSDPGDKTASCALSVTTGSYNDPDSVLGLAHLCEHAILAGGSHKFPDAGLYHTILAENGGTYNAYTTGEQTTFYFELPLASASGNSTFEHLLDIFSSAFKGPLFSEKVLGKEAYAIENEHCSNKASTSKIMYHATRLLANEAHPFSRFCTGNLATFNGTHRLKLKALLMNYFQNFYHAGKMTLVLRGPQSLNGLSKLALINFGNISAQIKPAVFSRSKRYSEARRSGGSEDGSGTKKSLSDFNLLEEEWFPKYCGQQTFSENTHNAIFIQSSKSPTVRLVFPINSKGHRFRSKDIDILSAAWCDIFGDESQGSFANFLTCKGFVTSLVTWQSKFACGSSGLILELCLTDTGLKRLKDIIRALFIVIEMITDEKFTEKLAQYLSQVNAIELLRFLYSDVEHSAMEMCAIWSTAMLSNFGELGTEFTLRSSPSHDCNKIGSHINNYAQSKESKVWWIGQAIKVQGFATDFITTKNLRVVIMGHVSKSPFSDVLGSWESFDPFYEFNFQKLSVDANNWQGECSEFAIWPFSAANLNQFAPSVTRDLQLIKSALLASSDQSRHAPLAVLAQKDYFDITPRLRGKNHAYEMWVKEESFDPSFKSRCIVSFEIISKCIACSPESTVQLEILTHLLFSTLSSRLYPAEKLSHTYEIYASKVGDISLGFTFSGFPEGVLTMIKLFIAELSSIADQNYTTATDYRKARIKVRNKYEEAASSDCATLASLGLLILLEKYMWPLEDRLDALEYLDQPSFHSFCSKFLNLPKYMNLIIQGDCSLQDEIYAILSKSVIGHLSKSADAQLSKHLTGANEFTEPQSRKLSEGTNLFFDREGSLDDPNNSIAYFIQTGERDDECIFMLTAFTDYLFSLTLVPELRTRRQIGYFVIGGLRILSDTIGIHITCASSLEPHLLEEAIDEFLMYLETEILQQLTEKDFLTKYVSPYLKLLQDENSRSRDHSGPVCLHDQIESNAHSGNVDDIKKVLQAHRFLRSQISSRAYNFESLHDEPVNLKLINSLTLKDYRSFFKRFLSISSPKRRKISIMIKSPMSPDQIMNQRLLDQMERFFKMKGLKISRNDLKTILEKAGPRPQSLFKALFQYFNARGMSFKLCTAVVSELFKSIGLGFGSRSEHSGKSIKPAIKLTSIHDLHQFRATAIFKATDFY